jgi:signal transduction histidine kinase
MAVDRIAAEAGAARWVLLWDDEEGWAWRSSWPAARDELLAGLAPGWAADPTVEVLATPDLGDGGRRMRAAGVGQLLVLPSQEAVLVLEDPRVVDVEGLRRAEGLIPLLGSLLAAERRAAGLTAVAAWQGTLGSVISGDGGVTGALEALIDRTGHRTAVALTPVPGGLQVAAAWREAGSRRTGEAVLEGASWEPAPGSARAALLGGARRVGLPSPGGWTMGVSDEPALALGVAGGAAPLSSAGAAFAARLLAVAVEHRRLAGDVRASLLVRERARIASVIHEGISQVLSNVAIRLDILGQVLDQPERASAMVRSSRGAVLEALDGLRGAAFELTVATPDWGDLATGLARYVDEFGSQWGLETGFRVEGKPRRIQGDVLALAFAIAHEGLTNVRKHAGTSRADVALRFEPGWVSLRVLDPGVGFDPHAAQGESLRQRRGLALARSRARAAGARLDVRSAVGRGSSLTVRIPT